MRYYFYKIIQSSVDFEKTKKREKKIQYETNKFIKCEEFFI